MFHIVQVQKIEKAILTRYCNDFRNVVSAANLRVHASEVVLITKISIGLTLETVVDS